MGALEKYPQILDAVEEYKQGDSFIASLAKKYLIPRKTLEFYINKQDLPKKEWQKADEEKILNLFLSGIQATKIAKKLHLGLTTVCRYIRNNNLIIEKRTYSFDENYFEFINTPQKAYFLGLFVADMTVIEINGRPYHVILCLARKDEYLIYQFLNCIGSDHKVEHFSKITKGKLGFYSRVTICSEKMASDLFQLECAPRKTYTHRWPILDQVPEHLLPHFLLGYTDGDGSWTVTIKPDKKSEVKYGIVSNYEFCVEAQKWLIKECNISQTKIVYSTGIWKLQYGGVFQVDRIGLLLYKDPPPIFLARKKEKFDKLHKHLIETYGEDYQNHPLAKIYLKKIKIKSLEPQIIEDYNNQVPFKSILEKYDIGASITLTRILRRNGIEPNRSVKLTQGQIDQIITQYKNGDSIHKISRDVKVDRTTVKRINKATEEVYAT